jgi:TolB protein
MIQILRRVIAVSFAALCLSAPGAGAQDPVGTSAEFPMIPTIAFSSTRDGVGLEIYLMDADGTNVRRLTDDTSGEAFAALSPDGKGKIVFDSNRARLPGEPVNTSDLFLMNKFGEDQTYLTRGSGASWSPNSKGLAYQRSASATGLPDHPGERPTRPGEPGAPTSDSDIFVIDNLGDFQDGLIQPRNLTNSPDKIDEDADWSPLGDKIAYTSKDANDPSCVNCPTAEIYVRNADGSGTPTRLTFNSEEERALTWSPDGTRILYMCRHGGPDFELCVINPDGSGLLQLTDDTIQELTPTWSTDGSRIVFHSPVGGLTTFQLFSVNANDPIPLVPIQITQPPGINGWAKYGVLRDTGLGN